MQRSAPICRRKEAADPERQADMSLFLDVNATCRRCATKTGFRLAASVNADRRPDLRQSILDGTFQSETCPGCGAALRLPMHLSYLDIGRGQWILAEDVEKLPEWRDVEVEAQDVFDATYGKDAPRAAQEIGAVLRPRLVLGWPALRETLITDELVLDPVVIELLKIVILRRVPDSPLADTTELRLVGEADGALEFAWLEGASENMLAGLPIGRDAYDAIAADREHFSGISRDLEGHLFLDFRRMILA